jgi:transcriptional regulator with XRE-family HTH domain
MNTEQTGDIIRFHRRKAGLSRIALAHLAGVGKSSIYDIENHKTSVRCSTLHKVLTALNIRLVFESPLMESFRRTQREKG